MAGVCLIILLKNSPVSLFVAAIREFLSQFSLDMLK